MRIEDEIKSRGFKSEYQKLEVNLIYTYHWSRDRKMAYFKKTDITMPQYNVLRILRGNYPNPYSTSQIRERMLDKMSDASRMVDRLYAKGYVDRKICNKDKRLVDVVINEKGLSLLKKTDKYLKESEKDYKNISVGEARKLNHLLDKLRG